MRRPGGKFETQTTTSGTELRGHVKIFSNPRVQKQSCKRKEGNLERKIQPENCYPLQPALRDTFGNLVVRWRKSREALRTGGEGAR